MDETDPKKTMLEKLKIVGDEPEEDDLQFEFDGYARWLVSVLKTLPTPFTVGIHGEWGSGKTSLIKRIRKAVREYGPSGGLCLVEFDAWKHERADVLTALLTKISSEFTTGKKQFARAVAAFMADAALRHYGASGVESSTTNFKKFLGRIDTIHDSLEKIVRDKLGDGRMIVVIDDLDRCHADNVLDMMEAIKMFLSVKNLVFVIAADMTKIERAWALRYQGAGSDEGREHADKMFQIMLPLPPKSDAALRAYVEKMAESFDSHSMAHFLQSVPPNPRKIKRSINLLHCLLDRLDIPQGGAEYNARFSTYFDVLITWVSLCLHHPRIAKRIYSEPAWLIRLASICRLDERFDSLKKRYTGYRSGRSMPTVYAVLPAAVSDMLNEIVDADNASAFRTLKGFAECVGSRHTSGIDPDKDWTVPPNPIYDIVKHVIGSAGMVSA